MSKVKVSKDLIDILKNFSTINKSIVIESGNVVSTLSINKNILAKATVTEEFSKQVAIYDLGVFLGGVSLFDAPVFDLESDSFVTVQNEKGRSKSRYYYADPEIIVKPPSKDIQLPSVDVEFFLPSEELRKLLIASSVYQVPDLCVYSEDGKIQVSVRDKKNDTSNSFNVTVGTTDDEFCYCFKVENLRMIPGSYNVEISQSSVALFTNKDHDVKYWIALEP
jgi:hypothetical protein